MTETALCDAWKFGDTYEAYIGRWSRAVAPLFLDWLDADKDLDWLDVGCGTGALSAAVVGRCRPNSLIALDSSDSFIAQARASVVGANVDFRVGSAEALDLPSESRDLVVSALLLNFLPNKEKALAEARRVTRGGGLVGFYVWDYPGHGLEFVDVFWSAAASLDPKAREFDVARRFPFCTADGLRALAKRAGQTSAECWAIEVPTLFRDFEDFWRPFTVGAGAAPEYCASLADNHRQRLKNRLRDSLTSRSDGSIAMIARAWAIKSRVM